MTEPTVEVPVSLIERIRDTYSTRDYVAADSAVAALLALLSQPTPTAEPPRIEDMAPGTTFIVLREERWTVLPHQVAVQDGHEVGRYLEEFDPSTIRDVTPPKDAA